jgi:hypothetical protein
MQAREIMHGAAEQSGGFAVFVRFRNAVDGVIVAAP